MAIYSVLWNQSKDTYSRADITNQVPILVLTQPSNAVNIYENDIFTLSGTVTDADVGNSVTIRYQLNAGVSKAIKAFVSDGKSLEAFSKSLTFRGGALYDGDLLIINGLAEGVEHKLKVWATDDHDGTSTIMERDFYVVPNRAPNLTVTTPTPAGTIDSDSFNISGTYSDDDKNNTTVKYRINGGNSIQVAEGISGNYDFDITLGKLQLGDNTIVVDATDSYGAKTSKTIKFRKNEVKTPITRSTVRYKVEPPTGSASEMLAWIQHDAGLTLNVSASMTLSGEAESYVAMTPGTQVTLSDGQVESEFYIDAGAPKDTIVLQIDMTKTSVDADEAITLIAGVF